MKNTATNTKGSTTKPLRGPGSEPAKSALIGGVGNSVSKLNAAKKYATNAAGNYCKGGKVRK